MNINTGETGEQIDCPVCVVLRYVQYWCPAGSGGEEGEDGMRLSFCKTKLRSCYFVFVYFVFFDRVINVISDPPPTELVYYRGGGWGKQWE